MIPISDFFLHVYPDVVGCPEAYIKDAIRASVIEFCDKSMAYEQIYVCSDLKKGQSKYALNYISSGLTIAQPLTVIIANCGDDSAEKEQVYKVLTKTNEQDLDTLSPDWRLQEAEVPSHYFFEMPNVIRLVERPTQSIANGLHIRVAARPSRTADTLPTFLYNEWLDTIVDGALYRLHSMSDKSWARPEMVNYYLRRFRAGISRAKSKFYKSHVVQSKGILPVVTLGEMRPFNQRQAASNSLRTWFV